uniref:Uncharacterized protein n=1 Tax=Setaria digitata TaxID=48799 RepID=A0A915PL35_9BILA
MKLSIRQLEENLVHERKEEGNKEDDEELISLSRDIMEEDDMERKKRKKRKTKRSGEMMKGHDMNVSGSRHWQKTKKKRRPVRHQNSGSDENNGTESGGQTVNVSTSRDGSSAQKTSPVRMEENTKTALCSPSMEAMASDDRMDDPKASVNYEAMYDSLSESKYNDLDLIVELRYWAVLALFIFILIIYRSFLPPIQCDIEFQ